MANSVLSLIKIQLSPPIVLKHIDDIHWHNKIYGTRYWHITRSFLHLFITPKFIVRAQIPDSRDAFEWAMENLTGRCKFYIDEVTFTCKDFPVEGNYLTAYFTCETDAMMMRLSL